MSFDLGNHVQFCVLLQQMALISGCHHPCSWMLFQEGKRLVMRIKTAFSDLMANDGAILPDNCLERP